MFFDIKKILEENKVEVKEKLFYNKLLSLFNRSKEDYVLISDVKLTFFEILKGNISNEEIEIFNKERELNDIDYLKKLSGVGDDYTNNYEKIMLNRYEYNKLPNSLSMKADRLIETGSTIKRTGSEIMSSLHSGKNKFERSRKDVFSLHCYFNPKDEKTVVLNENKLASLYG